MGAGAECFTDGEEEHGYEEMPVILAKTEYGKGNDIGDKGQNHAAAAAKQIGNGAARDFYKVDEKLPEGDKKTDLGKGKSLLEEKQDNERFKIPLILKETI